MHTKKTIGLALFLALATAPAPAHEGAKLVVVATLPYLAEVASAVGGKEVEVHSLCPAETDPHFVVPTPAMSVLVGRADVFLENGFQLELWAERVIDGARNQQIRPGYPGYMQVGQGLIALNVPAQTSRALGDVHPAGNPHVWLDPLNLEVIAKNVETCLAKVRPEHAAEFAANRKAFEERLREALYGADLVKVLGASALDRLQRTGRLHAFLKEKQYKGKPLVEKAGGWLKRGLALEGTRFISYHQDWDYFAQAFGLVMSGTIEEKPGIPPSPTHLEQLTARAKADGTKLVVYTPYYPSSRAEGVADSIGGKAVLLPSQPGATTDAKDLFGMYDAVFTRIEQAKAGQ